MSDTLSIMYVFIADTSGTNFAFVFPYRRVANTDLYVHIINQAMSSTDVTLFIPEFGITETRTLTSTGNDRYVKIPVQRGVTLPKLNGLHSNKMLRVESTGPVSVVGGFKGTGVSLSLLEISGETFSVLPTNTLGELYIAPSYDNGNAPPHGYSLLIVSAINANTQINIELDGQTVTKTLNQYYSYQVLAGLEAGFPAATDLTGAFVHTDQPVVVISGHGWGKAPLTRNARDAMIEQIPPLTTLGTHYVLTPLFLTHINAYSYRVIASLCETTITITPTGGSQTSHTLQPSEFREGDSTTVVDITSNNPILVAQYCQGGELNGKRGDPCMIIIPPTELFSDELVFSVDTFENKHVNLITECDYSGTVSLDGDPYLDDTDRLETSDGTYCVLQQSLSAGPYHVKNDNPDASLLAVVYAFEFSKGSGHVAGFNLSKYQFKE